MNSSPDDPSNPETSHRALPSADNAPAPLRGEVFDFDLDSNHELETENRSNKAALAWFLAGLAALFCAFNFGAYVGQKSRTPAPVVALASRPEKLAPLRVQIAGRVKKPGVYTLRGGARLQDAIQQAGGALPGADLNGFNLADWVVDGSKIEVPNRRAHVIAPTPTPVVIIKEVFVTLPQNAPDATDDTPTGDTPTGDTPTGDTRAPQRKRR